MPVVFDTTIIVLALNPDAKPSIDPKTNAPLEHARQRVDYLIRILNEKKSKVVIPAPVLCEVLVHTDRAANEYIKRLQRPPFLVVPFDSRAAIECAEYLQKHGFRGKNPTNPRAKIKFDWQIMAIASTCNAETVYSDDKDILEYGRRMRMRVVRSFDLELDPNERQLRLEIPVTIQSEVKESPHVTTSGSS
jgi:predicted nucleic acid-binding protein